MSQLQDNSTSSLAAGGADPPRFGVSRALSIARGKRTAGRAMLVLQILVAAVICYQLGAAVLGSPRPPADDLVLLQPVAEAAAWSAPPVPVGLSTAAVEEQVLSLFHTDTHRLKATSRGRAELYPKYAKKVLLQNGSAAQQHAEAPPTAGAAALQPPPTPNRPSLLDGPPERQHCSQCRSSTEPVDSIPLNAALGHPGAGAFDEIVHDKANSKVQCASCC